MDPMDFDDPHPSAEDNDLGMESPVGQIGSMLEPLRPYAQHIAAAAVILAIAWFAYDYFFASMVGAEITLKNTEGEPVENSSLKIFAPESKEPFFSEKGKPAYAISLKPGHYTFEARADGYSPKKGSIDVGPKEKAHTIFLEKGLGVEIQGLKQAIPERMFVGGKTVLLVQLKNNSGLDQEVELLAENGLEGMLAGQKITVPAKDTETVELEISIPSSASVKDQKTGDEKEAVLRIKYTNEKESANFRLFPNPVENISFNTLNLGASARENDNKDEGGISIKNSNKFSVDGLVLSVEITSAGKNSTGEVLKWLQFPEIANGESPREIRIASIGAGDSVKKELQLVVPLNAKKELGIKGSLVLDAPYFPQPIKKTLTIDVKAEAEFGISISALPKSPVEIRWDETLGRYEDTIISLKAENTGQLDLKNIVFSIDNDSDCDTDWLEFKENNLELLRAGETGELKLAASAPIAVRGQESSRQCDIRYRHDDPVTTGRYFEKVEPAFVEIKPEES